MPMRVTYTVLDGEILSENRGGVERDYISDPLGSTMALLNNSQTKTDTWGYWPYGEVKSRTGTTATPFQYVGTRGYYRDTASRTYVRARHYRQDQGRWMTEDPIGFRGSDINQYRYVGSRPVNIIDPSGLQRRNCEADRQYCITVVSLLSAACIAIAMGIQAGCLAKCAASPPPVITLVCIAACRVAFKRATFLCTAAAAAGVKYCQNAYEQCKKEEANRPDIIITPVIPPDIIITPTNP